MKILPWLLVLVILLGAVGFVGFYYGIKLAKPAPVAMQTINEVLPTDTPALPTLTPDPMASWKVLSNLSPKYNVKYPIGVDFTTDANAVKHLIKVGDVDLAFKAGALDGKTLKEFSDKKAAEMGGVFETSPVIATSVAGFPGYKFHVKGYSEGDYYYLDLGTNSYLEIFDASKDPKSALEILATLSQ